MKPRELTAIVDGIWLALGRAVREHDHPWRMTALATAEPSVRMMVLRGALAPQRRLLLFTDARSHKVATLRANPAAECLFWNPHLREQVRVMVHVTVHAGDEVADAHWLIRSEGAWREYATVAPPRHELAPGKERRSLRLSEAAAARNFAVLSCGVGQIDWMRLSPDGEHSRARFIAASEGWHACELS